MYAGFFPFIGAKPPPRKSSKAAHQSGNKICFHIASARMGHRGPIEMLITGRMGAYLAYLAYRRTVVKQIRHGITKDAASFVAKRALLRP